MDWQLSEDVQPSGPVPADRLVDSAPVPVTGAWLPGDDPGERRFCRIGLVPAAAGVDAVIAYEQWGTLAPDASNAILVLHALTGDSHVVGEAGPGHATSGWWRGIVGPGRALDTDRFFVVAPNMLGGCQGSTGPATPAADGRALGSRFGRVTIRDQVDAQRRLADALGIERFFAIVGGSMGGMHALEWAVTHPGRVARAAILAAPAISGADQIALNSVQLEAVRTDAHWSGGDYYDRGAGHGPHRGLALARRMALLSYRSPIELNARFGRAWQSGLDPAAGGRFQVESYLDVHGNRFTRRFDAGSYVRLVEAMSSHDVGAGRGGVEAALRRIEAECLVLGIDSDRLFPVDDQARITRGVRRSVTGAEPLVLESEFGHDGFLIETDAVGAALRTLIG